MKETAVEWFFNELQRMNYFIGNDMVEAYKQAKEMEKQQIVEAHGFKTKSINQDQSKIITGNKYYNETFKSE